MKTQNLTIAVVDDDIAVRDAVVTLLSLEGHRAIPFEGGPAFLATVDRLQPDVLLLDLQMPEMTGLELLEALPKPVAFPCIMISAHGEISSAVQAIKNGAMEFLEKPVDPDHLLEVLQNALLSFAEQNAGDPAFAAQKLEALTERENEVARVLATGATNKETARQLDLSPRTVETHRAHIFQKLGVRNIAGLIRLMQSSAG
ncbi:MAG: response regulator transcription factor [Alphaproteobacteria bacterium]